MWEVYGRSQIRKGGVDWMMDGSYWDEGGFGDVDVDVDVGWVGLGRRIIIIVVVVVIRRRIIIRIL